METSAIGHRVADFLKKHAPFHVVEDADLLQLAATGRVRFYEPNEYILWQGEPYQMRVMVIQQGTIALWDEQRQPPELRDIRGPGDALGLEQFNDEDTSLYSARSTTDVVVYTFPAIEFEAFVLKYPYARDYIAAQSKIDLEYATLQGQLTPHGVPLRDLVSYGNVSGCAPTDSVRDAARWLQTSDVDAVAIVDQESHVHGAVTRGRLLQWLADGAGDIDQPVEPLTVEVPVVHAGASSADAAVAMAAGGLGLVGVTDNGARDGRFLALVTPRDLNSVFGDTPAALLKDARRATSLDALHAVNWRARAFTLRHLTSAGAVEWLMRFTHLMDATVLRQLAARIGPVPDTTICVCGRVGRAENVTLSAPHLVMVTGRDANPARALDGLRRLVDEFTACGYLSTALPFDLSFYVASVSEWQHRYAEWMRKPIEEGIYHARSLFDLRPLAGPSAHWQAIKHTVDGSIARAFLYVLANDCLNSLPPLTFYEDAVVDTAGGHQNVFRLDVGALRPIVDVGRVFGMASGTTLGASTQERLQAARALLPAYEAIFQDALDALHVLLWQRGRVGISQGTDGAEVPPSQLSRYDRQVLKSGFRSIQRLLEFTGNAAWLDRL